MANHLPECTHDSRVNDWCICDRLRACEQRVTERHNAEHEDDRLAAFQNGYDAATVKERQRSVLLIADGYAAGVQAARDAVLKLNKPWARAYMDTDALAAIDALMKEKP